VAGRAGEAVGAVGRRLRKPVRRAAEPEPEEDFGEEEEWDEEP
jgi:hypothetical protein